MNKRLQTLIDKGYSEKEVIDLSSFTDDDLAFACKSVLDRYSGGITGESKPLAIYIGGQPGCGKSVFSMNLKRNLPNSIEIGIDNYRTYHPNYLKMEECIRKHWEGKTPSENESMGNDIADFTHEFAGKVTDLLIDECSKNKYNMLLEWGMRNPIEPYECMKKLHDMGYTNYVNFVVTNKNQSYDACQRRTDIMKGYNHIVRKVPKSFHDYAVETLPDAVDYLNDKYNTEDYIQNISLINREGKIIWNPLCEGNPKEIYQEKLNENKISKINNMEDLSVITNGIEYQGLSDLRKKENENSNYFLSTLIGGKLSKEEELYNGKSSTHSL